MFGEGEVVGDIGFKILRQVGFEIRSPGKLAKDKEFPDCETIFAEIVSQTSPSQPNVRRYIWLCRLNALAWLTWFVISASVWIVIGMWLYHYLRGFPLSEHILFSPIKCVAIVLAFCGVAFLAVMLYNGLRFSAQQLAGTFAHATKEPQKAA